MRLFALPLLLSMIGCAVSKRTYQPAPAAPGMTYVPAKAPPWPASRPTNRDARKIRVVSAPVIREISAASGINQRAMRSDVRAWLPAPNRLPAEVAPRPVRSAADLRSLVGRRDTRPPTVAAVTWARDLGAKVEGVTGSEVLDWAEHSARLVTKAAAASPGDLLVFDHAQSDQEADLVAIVIARDPRGVTEMLYVGGGVVRRGFVDPTRPSMRRDAATRIVNTFMRHGKRWPPKRTHYLAGELLSHVVRAR